MAWIYLAASKESHLRYQIGSSQSPIVKTTDTLKLCCFQEWGGGDLPTAPIWDDVQTLKGKMLPRIDIIYGGFPCQDISVAGLGKGLEGKRSGLFFQIVRLVDEVRPTFVFLENVPAITTRGLGMVTAEITKRGYDCRWTTLSAAEVGANHKRERWWLLAYSNRNRFKESNRARGFKDESTKIRQESSSQMESKRICTNESTEGNESIISNTISQRGWIQQEFEQKCEDTSYIINNSAPQFISNTKGEGLEGLRNSRGDAETVRQEKQPKFSANGRQGGWWSVEPDVGRLLFNGVSLKLGEEIDGELRSLWEEVGTKTVWQESGRFQYLQEAKILRPYLYGTGTNEGISVQISTPIKSEKIQKRIMRAMCVTENTLNSPHRWKLEKQQFNEFNDALFCLSYIFASQTRRLGREETERALLYLWSGILSVKSLFNSSLTLQEAWRSLNGAWKESLFMSPWNVEPPISRVVEKLPHRVDRIKCLGNAVVPLQAKEAFKELIGL